MNTACAVLLVEPDFIVQLIVTNARYDTGAKDTLLPKRIVALVAVNEDSDAFLTAPDYKEWVASGEIAVLSTKDRTAEQKDTLRKNFIEKQINALKANLYTEELSMNKYEQAMNAAETSSLFGKIKVSLFGHKWNKAWKADALKAEGRIAAATNPAFNFLLKSNVNVEKARLGILYLAHKHKFDAMTQREQEQAGMKKIFKQEDGPQYLNNQESRSWGTDALARFGLRRNPARRVPQQTQANEEYKNTGRVGAFYPPSGKDLFNPLGGNKGKNIFKY